MSMETALCLMALTSLIGWFIGYENGKHVGWKSGYSERQGDEHRDSDLAFSAQHREKWIIRHERKMTQKRSHYRSKHL